MGADSCRMAPCHPLCTDAGEPEVVNKVNKAQFKKPSLLGPLVFGVDDMLTECAPNPEQVFGVSARRASPEMRRLMQRQMLLHDHLAEQDRHLRDILAARASAGHGEASALPAGSGLGAAIVAGGCRNVSLFPDSHRGEASRITPPRPPPVPRPSETPVVVAGLGLEPTVSKTHAYFSPQSPQRVGVNILSRSSASASRPDSPSQSHDPPHGVARLFREFEEEGLDSAETSVAISSNPVGCRGLPAEKWIARSSANSPDVALRAVTKTAVI